MLSTDIFKDKLNDKNLLSMFSFVIKTGTAQLLEFPERKEGVTNDWREENGTETDLDLVRFKDKEVTLDCAIVTDTDTEFWTAYNAFFAELTKPGLQSLFIFDHSQTYQVSYKKTSNFIKTSKNLIGVPKVFVKFNLTLQVKF